MSEGPHIISHRKPGPLPPMDPELARIAREAIPDVGEAFATMYDMATTPSRLNLQQRWPDEDKALLKQIADDEDRTETACLLRIFRQYAKDHKHILKEQQAASLQTSTPKDSQEIEE